MKRTCRVLLLADEGRDAPRRVEMDDKVGALGHLVDNAPRQAFIMLYKAGHFRIAHDMSPAFPTLRHFPPQGVFLRLSPLRDDVEIRWREETKRVEP